jgi:hypothetical protein
VTGKPIVLASWVSLAVFAIFAIPDALGLHALDLAAAFVSLGLFLVSIGIWIYSFAAVLVRSTHGDDIVVSSWVFLTGSAPADVRKQLMGAVAVSIVLALATAWANPFGVLVPMLSLAFAALWGARHGTYPPRRMPVAAKGARR